MKYRYSIFLLFLFLGFYGGAIGKHLLLSQHAHQSQLRFPLALARSLTHILCLPTRQLQPYWSLFLRAAGDSRVYKSRAVTSPWCIATHLHDKSMASRIGPVTSSMAELPFAIAIPSVKSPSLALSAAAKWRWQAHKLSVKSCRHPKASCVCTLALGDIVTDALGGLPLVPVDDIQRVLQEDTAVASTIRTGISTIAALPESQRWQYIGTSVAGWVYLTARPGVLWGALDAFIFSPLQFIADKLTGRRNLKRTDFLIEQRIGEGSFGTVFAGAMVPRNVDTNEELGRRSRRIEEYDNYKSFQKVILKKPAGVLIFRALERLDCSFLFERLLSRSMDEESQRLVLGCKTACCILTFIFGLEGKMHITGGRGWPCPFQQLTAVKVGILGAEECGEVEEWFNYRMSRAAPDVCANFLGSFIADTTRGQFTEGGRWLVWKFEGDSTLADFMRDRKFPENLSEAMFGAGLKNRDPVQRNALIIKKITRQIITSLKKVHDTGIVHRDVKPSNLVVTNKGKVKLIDFGAAADLRVGKNYVPNRGMLDPDYCPPELYVMPEETPTPPPAPVAAALSPFLWQFNSPDLFDMYSVGIIFMQMACPGLRTSLGLQSFKSELEGAGYDLKKWRQNTKLRPNLDILDMDGGKGWDLATKLICERGFLRRGRLSAGAALRHPYFLLGGDQAATVLSKLSVTK